MAKCPECATEIPEPTKFFKNTAFHIEAYNCPKCKNHFHITR